MTPDRPISPATRARDRARSPITWFVIGVGVLAAGLAVWLLSHIDWAHTVAAARALDPRVVAQALGLTALSDCGLAAYDVIALGQLRHRRRAVHP